MFKHRRAPVAVARRQDLESVQPQDCAKSFGGDCPNSPDAAPPPKSGVFFQLRPGSVNAGRSKPFMESRGPAVIVAILLTLLVGCKSHGRDGVVNVTVDLNKTAPIGYEICGDRGPKLARGVVDLKLLMPGRIEIPADIEQYGAKFVEFRPGRHEIDLYRNLHSARVVYTKADLAMEGGVPTVRVKLDTSRLSKGKYVLGISGDPFFAYCTVDIE